MSKFVSLETFCKYQKIDKEDNDELFEIYLSSAQDVIENYLGYSLEEKEYNHKVKSLGGNLLSLKAMPISKIEVKKVDELLEVESKEKNIIRINPEQEKNTSLNAKYTAGFTEETIAGIIKLTILRIASTMASEEGGDIAITGKSFGSEGGRTFISSRDYSKFLKELDAYRIL